jgi:uncharacterized protein YdaU (DUF1376 family)
MMCKAARSAYRDLLDYCWDAEGKLPNDQETLRKLADCSVEEWAQFGEQVLRNFYLTRDGYLTNSRIWAQLKERKAFVRMQIQKANTRWKNHAAALPGQCSVSPSVSVSVSTPKSIKSYRAKTALIDPDFEKFWQAYPRKVGKKPAYLAWKRSGAPLEQLLSAVKAWQATEQWQEVQFIPHAATFLNQRRWEDPAPAEGENHAGPSIEEMCRRAVAKLSN